MALLPKTVTRSEVNVTSQFSLEKLFDAGEGKQADFAARLQI